jgi:hypothetical protein
MVRDRSRANREINANLKKLALLRTTIRKTKWPAPWAKRAAAWLSRASGPPRTAQLPMSIVESLWTYRYIPRGKPPGVWVVGPRRSAGVFKLTPRHQMFDAPVNTRQGGVRKIGGFRSDEHRKALSGSKGETWWIADKSLMGWLAACIKSGEQLLLEVM